VGIKNFIIRRHIISEGKHLLTNLSAFISIFGVAIGVASLITVLSITSGFQKAYKDKILAHSGEIFIRKYGNFNDYQEDIKKIKEVKGVVGATPINYYQVLISSKNGDKGAQLKAVDLNSINSVANFTSMISNKNSIEIMKKTKNGIMPGIAMAEALNLKVGDDLTITFPFDKSGKVSAYPKIVTFKIVDFISTGMYDFDSVYLYMSLNVANELFKTKSEIKGIEVKVNDIENTFKIAESIRKKLGHYPFVVSTYKEMFSNLFKSIDYQKMFIGIVLIVIIILASFSIIGTLLIFVTEKEKDIALLKAVGLSKNQLIKLFVIEGGVIGIIGIILGLIISAIILLSIKYIDIKLAPDVYNISYIPISLKLTEVSLVIVISFTISILSTIYPAYKAAKLNPAEGISGKSISK
jgi:lipoprotein-releasing system permease protein